MPFGPSLAKERRLGHIPHRLRDVTSTSPETIHSQDEPHEAADRAGWSVRRHLTLFTIALVLPILLLLGVVLWRFATAEQTRLEREASDLASAIAIGLDRELTGIFASLDVLSTSAHLQSRDFEAFHKQASILLERRGIVTVLTEVELELVFVRDAQHRREFRLCGFRR